METEQQKIGILDQFILAVSRPKEYKKLIVLKTGKIILYTLLMALILTVMSYIIPAAGWLLSYHGFEGFIENQIPEFTFANGQLDMKSDIVIKQAGVSQIIVDTSKDKVSKKDLEEGYMQQILVSKNNMIISSMTTTNEIEFSRLKNVYLSKASLLKLVPILYISLAVAVVMEFIVVLLGYIFSAFIYGLIAMFYTSMEGKNISLGDAIKAAIYAKTLAAVFGAFNTVMGSFIPSSIWSFLSMFITMLLLLLGIRSDDKEDPKQLLQN